MPARQPGPDAADAVADFHRQQLAAQADQDALNARRPEYDRVTVWAASWIPVASHGAGYRTSGLYLEDVAGMRDAPALATRDDPGLVGGALVWGSRWDSAQEDRWRPLAG